MLVKIRGYWLDPENVVAIGEGFVMMDGGAMEKGARVIGVGGLQLDVTGTPDEVAAEINEAIKRVRRFNAPRRVEFPGVYEATDKEKEVFFDAVARDVGPIERMKDDARERLDAIVDEAMIAIAESGVQLNAGDRLSTAVKKLIDRYALAPALTASENERDRLHNMITEAMEKIGAIVPLNRICWESLPAAIDALITHRPINIAGVNSLIEKARKRIEASGVVLRPIDGLLSAIDKLISQRTPKPAAVPTGAVRCPCWIRGQDPNAGGQQCVLKDGHYGDHLVNPQDAFVVAEKTVEPLCHGSDHFQAAGTDHCICGALSLLEIKNYDMIQVQLNKRPGVDPVEEMDKAARKVAAAVRADQVEKDFWNRKPSSWARKLAAGAWTTPATSNKVMDPLLCDAFALILDSLKIAHLRQPAMALAKELQVSLAMIDEPLAGTERLMLPITVVREFLVAVNSIDGLKLSESRQIPLPGCD